ncbi:hypothetical protein [Bremerella volcania]|uniref:hypothetical protein n=1 Tax=Bremerella volcania TaxID=2527984 RepID=UPI0011A458E3|nr:hypothetical protein [Bremerella volcania]
MEAYARADESRRSVPVDGGKWPAQAKIDGNNIRWSSPDVPSPVVVRFAFVSFPQVNLVNEQELPAVPFRTDNDSP